MAGLKSMVVLIVMMVASFQLQSTVGQTRHVVGDVLGWTIPPGGAAAYATWASQRTFTVGDTLFFNFTTGLHNVAEVSSATYDPCTPTNIISLNPTGPATLTLTRPGNHYYMCTVISHCQIGQKLSIIVSPKTTTPRSTPSATLSPPPVIASTPPTVSPIPSPSISASPPFTALVPLTFMAVVLAFFY